MKEASLSVLVVGFIFIIVGLALEPSGEFGLPWIFLIMGAITIVAGAIQVAREI